METRLKKLSVFVGAFNPLTFEDKLYKGFYNACGAHYKEKYPVFDVILNYSKKRKQELKSTPKSKLAKWKLSAFDKKYEKDYQEYFEFIRTEEGYKLFRVSLKG